jgi:glycosyltransferase involved in cell wall biosynthesis
MRKQRIALAALGGSGWMGGAEYIRNLARAVRSADPAVELRVICRSDDAAAWKEVAPVSTVPSWPMRWPVTRRSGLGTRFFAKVLRREQIDFVYPLTYDNEYSFGIRLPVGSAFRGVDWAGWIPDFQHRYLPELFTSADIAHRDRQIALLAADAPKIVLSSEHAAGDLRKFYPEHAAKAHVLTFATFPQADWASAYTDDELAPIPERFFVVCNQFWQHKNHLVIFRALQLLASRGVHPVVVCTGEIADYRNPAYAQAVKEAVAPFLASNQVRLLGLIPRRRQIELLRRALAVLQPSLFEGWSTVVEDARVLGRPSLLSDFPVHREQNPPGAQFFPTDSPEALAGLMEESWKSAKPGPDLDAEAEARLRADARIQEVGQRFLEITAA